MLAEQSRILRRAIDLEAKRLGFTLLGVTSPDPPPHIDVYQSWLNASLHGEMEYLATVRARQRRADPRQILHDCRSILSLGIRYPSLHSLEEVVTPSISAALPSNMIPARQAAQASASDVPPASIAETSPLSSSVGEGPGVRASLLSGRVASYAWGADYHDVLAERLRTLVVFVETKVGTPVANRWYTDTGPLLERDLAQRAGLGWIGKNTCLIHPHQGSYFFLAEILLSLDMEPEAPFAPDYCGDCTRCLEACPTACILPNRTIDSRRCISYLTIELKGPIPLELRPRIGDWVFGCDLCQQACPWNQRFSSPDGDSIFAPRPGIPRPILLQELSLSPQDFNRKFKGSPIRRARRRGYLRNVAVALGNKGDPEAVPTLAQAMSSDPEPLVRGHIAWALGHIGDKPARRALSTAARIEDDAYVLKEILSALETSGR